MISISPSSYRKQLQGVGRLIVVLGIPYGFARQARRQISIGRRSKNANRRSGAPTKAPIPPRLLRFLKARRRKTRQYVFEQDLTQPGGPLTLAPLGNIAHGFASAACNAGMGYFEKVKRKRKQREGREVWENLPHAEITPHVTRHTCITWLLQRRVPIREVAGFVGATEKIIEDVYGHHSPDHMATARDAFNKTIRAQ